MCQLAVHHQLVTAEPFPKRSTGSFLLVFRHIQRQGLIFRPISPAHGLVLPYPSFMLHRCKNGGVTLSEMRHHAVPHRLVGIEAMDRIQISGKISGPVDGRQLILQRERVEFFLHLLLTGIRRQVSGVKRQRKIVQMQEAAVREIRAFSLLITFPYNRFYRQRDQGGIHDFLDIRCKPLLLSCHVAVCLEPRFLSRSRGAAPRFISAVESFDFCSLRRIIRIDGVDCIAGKIKRGVHGMELRSGIAPISRTVPALQFITQHQQPGQRMEHRL